MSESNLTAERLVELHPRLFHMAAGGSWPSLEAHGLLPTSHLVATSGLPLTDQDALLGQRRAVSTMLEHPLYGRITIRDQLPLRLNFLRPKLIDVSVARWLEILNNRVFFWLHPDKLATLLGARAYKNREQDVLTIDTASLLRAHHKQIRLSPINSGSALYPNAALRGAQTFARIEEYPYAERRKGRSEADAITELAVIGGVPDLSAHIVGVDRYIGRQFKFSIVGDVRPV